MRQPTLPEMPRREALPDGPGERTGVVHAVYALYALGLVTGFTPLVGVVVAYLHRDAARGGWLETHVEWQIRTFWYGLLMQVVGWITVWILIGWAVLAFATLWFVWRVAKGWVRLANRDPIDFPQSFL